MVKHIPSRVAGQQSKASQAFLVIILIFGFLSFCLNLYLSMEMGSLKELSHLEHELMETFTEQSEALFRRQKSPSTSSILRPNNAASGGTSTSDGTSGHQLSGLQCEKYGGPSPNAAQEMVYWEDIPSDNKHVSPFQKPNMAQYLSFEPDAGGW
jgi:hypothetical protein